MVNNMTDLTAHDAAPAWQTRDHLDDPVIGELRNRFGPDAFTVQPTRTGVPVVWVKREQLLEVGDFEEIAEALRDAVRPARHGRTSAHAPRRFTRRGFFRFLSPDFNRPQPRHHAQGCLV